MEDSIILMSSMSPKIRNKLKPGEQRFRKVAGASILALKRNIRRSSVYDKHVMTSRNENLNIVESTSTESFPSLQLKSSHDESVIVISESDASTNSSYSEESEQNSNKNTNIKIEADYLLPKEKLAAISNWVANINIAEDNTVSSVYSDLSTICGNEFGKVFVPKEKDHAVNSTFVPGHHKNFDELFVKKNNYKLVDESVSLENVANDSFKNVVIEDSFEILNQTRLDNLKNKDNCEDDFKNNCSDKWRSLQISEDSVGELGNESFQKLDISNSIKKNSNNCESLKNNSLNKWQAVQISDDSGEDEIIAENLLDEIYGNSWRINKDIILTKTEPRKPNKKPFIKAPIMSESKPKFSLLYKNPYLDSEKTKSKNLLEHLHKSRLENTSKSPWLDRLKVLGDSDTNSDDFSKRKEIHKKLNFNESSDEDTNIDIGTKSKYFKKKIDKENTSNKKMDERPISDKSNSTSSNDSSSKNNKNIDIKSIKKSNKNRRRILDSSNSDIEIVSKPKINTDTKSNKNKISSTSSNNSSLDSGLKIIRKTKTESKKKKPIVPSIQISSDEEWDKEITRIERRLTISNDGMYSFLSSLSANVPISKCDISARIFRNNYKTYKNQLLNKLYKLYNEEVFDNILPKDMLLEWGDRMTKTAGFCYCKKITRRSGQIERSARIVLSTKVLDTANRLRDTLIHEMCHAATWIVNCVSDGHGDYWKAWALKAMKKFPELPPIQRCHNYTINTKYTYKCTGCGYSIGRHSKSLDIERKRCGFCHGKFEILLNKTNKKGETKAVIATPKKPATGFALFVKENYSAFKTPVRKHGEVMKVLGQKFKELRTN